MINNKLAGFTVRFDDVCINANMEALNEMGHYAHSLGAEVIYCISPLVHDMSNFSSPADERIYPKILNAASDYTKFYEVNKAGIPNIPDFVTRASHGLVHVDHRLLKKSAQEMSILVSCSLSKSKIFVPPFNKWNNKTEEVCKKHEITLIKFEDGWKCMEYNTFNPEQKLLYLHHREMSVEKFKSWFQ